MPSEPRDNLKIALSDKLCDNTAKISALFGVPPQNPPNAIAVEEMINKIGVQRNSIKVVLGQGSVSEKPACSGVTIEKKKMYEFEHWRELRLVCGDKSLSIYPDGGFANGWNLDTGYYHTKHEHFDHGNVRYNTAIHIKRDKGIKFDVCFNG